MKTLIVLLNMMNLACNSMAQTPLELQDIHFVIIETNMDEVNELQKTLQTYQPLEIELPKPENMDISKGYPTKPGFWLKTAKDKPSRYMLYYSPEDTIGKDVSFIPSRQFKLPTSGLSALVNSFDVHYCIVVRQFVNRAEAEHYIDQLITTEIITNETNVFPIPIAEYDHENLRFNFDKYLPQKTKSPSETFRCAECNQKHELNFEIKSPTSQSLQRILDENPNSVFRSTKNQYRVDNYIVFLGVVMISTDYKSDLRIEAWVKCEMDEILKGNQQLKNEGETKLEVQLFDNLLPYYKNTIELGCIAKFEVDKLRYNLPELTILDKSEIKNHQANGLTKSEFINLLQRQYH